MATASTRTVLATCLAFAIPANANVGPPSLPGCVAGDPAGIRGVLVERATVAIDLRPLAHDKMAQVEATYQLNNAGTVQQLELICAAAKADDFQLTLDGQPLTARRMSRSATPPHWPLPATTPKIPGRGNHGKLDFRARSFVALAISVSVPPGRHELKAVYASETGKHLYGEPTVYHQFVYVMAPAREWLGLTNLDVSVHLPPGWHAAATAELDREGDTLIGRYDSVPTDTLAITVQAPEGASFASLTYGTQAMLVGTVLLGLVGAWWLGRKLGRRARISETAERGYWGRHAWPWSMTWGIVWALMVFGSGILAITAPDWSLPAGQASHYGYGQAFAVIGVVLLSIILFPVGFAITQVSAVVVAGSARSAQR